MQDIILLAFRKRLKKRGYTDIHIKKDKEIDGNYVCTCVEPLARITITVSLPLTTFYYKMRD